MEFIYSKIVEAVQKVYNILYIGHVGSEVDGGQVAREINYINENGIAERINVKINTEGGSVLNGVRACNAILASQIPVYTYNEGYAMSQGAMTWLCAPKERRYMVDFGVLMIHGAGLVDEDGNPVLPDNENEANLLLYVNEQVKTMLMSNTGKSEEEVKKMMSKDTYFNPEQAVKAGLLLRKNIISYGKKPDTDPRLSISDNMKRIAAFYNSNNNNEKKMKQVAMHLGLSEDASELSILSAIRKTQDAHASLVTEHEKTNETLDATKTKLADAEARVNALQTENDKYKAEETKLRDQIAVTEVEAAIKEEKFDEKEKDSLIAIAKGNIDSFRAIAKAVKKSVLAPDVTLYLTNDSELTAVANSYGIKAENFNYNHLWSNERNDILKDLQEKHPALYKAMLNQWEKETL